MTDMVERVVFVTGLSGAGKSQTMKTFEDLGYYCVDNLPPALVLPTLTLLAGAGMPLAALALDVRSGGALWEADAAIAQAQKQSARCDVLFLDAKDDALVRRYSETRRRHPLAAVGALRDAIAAEQAQLAHLRRSATTIIDTTGLNHADLKTRLLDVFAPDGDAAHLYVTVVAFGFKYGLPLDLDMLLDVRFLRNPNYDDVLRPLTGLDDAVAAFIEDDGALHPFLERVNDLLDFLLPRYRTEGKTQLTIGFGCTGGRHRSVYVARRISAALEADPLLRVRFNARDIER
ncbi:MAG: RNase adapter RapZ [Vulcanimicrobiaceae bacterium]